MFPKEIKKLIDGKKVTRISIGRSDDEVYFIENLYCLKISTDIESLKKEKEVMLFLEEKIPVPKTVEYILENNKAYHLKTMIKGDSLASDKYLLNPMNLIDLLAKALKLFHSVKKSDQVFIHGDFCLPNIIIENNEITGFVDLAAARIGDVWCDYAWAIWSLEYNLKTKEYTNLLLEKLGIDFNQILFDKYTLI